MRSPTKRLLLYGISASMIALLSYVGFIYQPAPHPDSYWAAGEMFAKTDQWKSAREQFAIFLRHDPQNVPVLLYDAYCAQQLKQYADATADYEKLLQTVTEQDQIVELKIALAQIALLQEKPQQALGWVKNLHIDQPLIQAKIYVTQGQCFAKLGETSQAIEALGSVSNSLVNLEQASFEPLRLAAYELEKLGEIDQAGQMYERAKQAGDRESNYLLARLKFFQGDTDSAAAALQAMMQEESVFLERQLRADAEFRAGLLKSGLFPKGLSGNEQAEQPPGTTEEG